MKCRISTVLLLFIALATTQGVLIDRNIIAGNGTNPEAAQNLLHGIYATGSAFTITNHLIHSNTAYGIQVAAYEYREDSMAGPEYADARNWLISNNTIAFNKNYAAITRNGFVAS